jgi:ADP-ribose pyrophosphatase YjhB (NUDIX family)
MTNQHPRIGVSVVIHDQQGRVLLGLRSGRHCPGTWGLPGGAVEDGEDPIEAARRELEEETGLHPKAIRQHAVPYLSTVFEDGQHWVTIFFEAEYCGEPEVMEPAKCEQWAWFEAGSLPAPLFPAIGDGAVLRADRWTHGHGWEDIDGMTESDDWIAWAQRVSGSEEMDAGKLREAVATGLVVSSRADRALYFEGYDADLMGPRHSQPTARQWLHRYVMGDVVGPKSFNDLAHAKIEEAVAEAYRHCKAQMTVKLAADLREAVEAKLDEWRKNGLPEPGDLVRSGDDVCIATRTVAGEVWGNWAGKYGYGATRVPTTDVVVLAKAGTPRAQEAAARLPPPFSESAATESAPKEAVAPTEPRWEVLEGMHMAEHNGCGLLVFWRDDDEDEALLDPEEDERTERWVACVTVDLGCPAWVMENLASLEDAKDAAVGLAARCGPVARE